MKRFTILTLFPEAIEPYTHASILGRAQEDKVIDIKTVHIRSHATDKHNTVDDTPYGGGPGMVMKVEPIDNALTALNEEIPREDQHVIVLSAKGTPFTHQKAKELAESPKHITLICGRYEGIDQRVIDHLADEEISVGPYVLAGGELPALIVTEAVARHIPGVLGNPESLTEESHTNPDQTEYPQYTKPEEYNGWSVPKVLLSGNHKEIEEWRKKSDKSLT